MNPPVIAPREVERGGRGESRIDAESDSRWPVVELGDVCDVQLGKMLSPKSKTGVRPVPYLRNENVQWDRFDLTDVSWMDFSESEEAKFRLEPGDLLVCEGGEPGRAAIWQGQIERCCYQKALHRIRPRGGRLHPTFLMYRLWLSSRLREFADSQTQTTIAHLPREKLICLRIPLPPLAEQERIAGRLTEQLGAVERARAAAAQRLAAAESLPAALLREVFDGPQASGWETRTIDDFAKTCSGATPSRGNAAYFGGGIPWVKTGELRDGFVGDDGSTEESVTEAALRDCSLPLLPPGTLLIAMYGQGKTRGRTGILTREATTNQACFAILPDPEVFDTGFLQLWFRANYHDLRAMTENRGGNQPNLNGVLLRELEIPMPDAPTQRRLAADLGEKLAAAEGVIARCREELAAIEALPAALLRDAFAPSSVPGDGEGA